MKLNENQASNVFVYNWLDIVILKWEKSITVTS